MVDNIDSDYWPEIIADTSVNNFRIRYKVLYNDELIKCHDTLIPHRSLYLNIQYNKKAIINKEFRNMDFASIIPREECNQYQLSGTIQPFNITDSTVSFDLGYYIPDSDIGYYIMLTVTADGQIKTVLIDDGELGEN